MNFKQKLIFIKKTMFHLFKPNQKYKTLYILNLLLNLKLTKQATIPFQCANEV